MRSRSTAAFVTGALAAVLVLPASPAAASLTPIASTITGGADIGLLDESGAIDFSSPGDAFEVLERSPTATSPTVPFALADDTDPNQPAYFESDALGIVPQTDTAPFFGVTDTVNPETDGPVTATWELAVGGAPADLWVNADVAAMGDFESSDTFRFSLQRAGGAARAATAVIDEDAARSYDLAGRTVELNDPADLGPVALTNDFQTVSFPVSGPGDVLVVRFTAETNGSEAFAFRNLTVTDEAAGTVVQTGPIDDPDALPVCDAETITPIHDVQGDGFSSPVAGDVVTVRGVVTFANGDLGGIFVEEEPSDVDGDTATSEGIYVNLGGTADEFTPGQTVEATGRVFEFFGSTQLSEGFSDELGRAAVAVCDVEPLEITPTPLTLPAVDVERESLEGMLVKTTQQLDVTGLFSVFGEIGLTAQEGPLVQPTAEFAPDDPAAAAALAEQQANLLKLDDRGEFFADRLPWAQPPEGIGPRPGDTVAAGVTGPLSYTFSEYKIQPSVFPTIVAEGENPRPAAPSLVGGNDIGAFNVLNYFNTFGDDSVLRGATNQEDFELQTAKIVDAISTLDAAVLGLVELENDYEDLYDGDPSTEASIVTLVDALNDMAGFAKWDYVAPGEDLLTAEGLGGGGLGPDAIAVGIIYQPDRAKPTGTPATFDIDALLTGDSENNRWPLAQSFQVEGPGPDVTVVVNHFKSKGSSCDDTAGPGFDLGDDAGSDLLGNCDLTRQYATERLLEWLDTRPTGVDHNRNLVTGDLNAYEEERPITIFEEVGWTDLIEELGDDAFTYKFDGRYGRLDHALASPDLRKFVRDAAAWQANSLEYYNNLYDVAPIDDTAYASSDHDPVVVSLDAPGRSRTFGEDGRPGNARGR